MVEYFKPNQVLILPELAGRLQLKTEKFFVRQKFDGGMGTCYRIEDEQNRSYALKIIHQNLLIDENSIYRYHEEIKHWLTFSACEGVAEALCVTKINEIPCVVSTWMDNGDMSMLIKNMSKDSFYYCMDRIITTLKWVYDNYHVIHRDLKPGNILLDNNGNAYVSDWGLAKVIFNETHQNAKSKELAGINPYLTQSGAFVGTAPYASPEQLLGLPNIDFRSDIYSIGCIMYQWETGHPPFMGKTLQDIALGHLYTKPSKLGGIFKSTNFKAEKIIMKCLEKKAVDRYQSYELLLADLHKLAQKHVQNFKPYRIKERYDKVYVGHAQLQAKLNNKELGVTGTNGYGIVEQKDIMPYLNEAMSLSSLGEHQKAIDIYRRFFVKELFEECPDMNIHQIIAVNYANELNSIRKADEALQIILTISTAKDKSVEYYVNLSNIYISLLDFDKCVEVSQEGLKLYPNNIYLIGNQTVGLTQLGRLGEAVQSAEKRLSLGRDIHAICEAAGVMYKYAESNKNTDFPNAMDFYKLSLALYREALEQNPHYQTAMYNVAMLLFKMRRYADAMDYGAEISKIEKGTTEINAFYAARNMLWAGNFEGGLKFCDNWLKIYPNSTILKRIRAEILVDGYVIDNYTKDGCPIIEKSSLEFFEEIIKEDKTMHPSDIIYLAKIHCWMGGTEDVEYGLKLLEWGKSRFPENWHFNFYLSAYALKYKVYNKALQEALECRRKAPWREKAYSLLASVYSVVGQEDFAQKYRNEYKKINEQKKFLYNSCKTL